jgi:hypothetical protein
MSTKRKIAIVAAAAAVTTVIGGGVAYAVLPPDTAVCAASPSGGTLFLRTDADVTTAGVQCPTGEAKVDLQGAAGPAGPTGPQGPQGEVGEAGPQGEPGSILAGYVRVKGTQFTAPAPGTFTVFAVCPTADHEVLGGGYTTSSGVRPHQNFPGANEWTVRAKLATGQTLRAWAVCAVPAA